MIPASQDESSRLAALHAYGVLDTPAEVGFEHITSLVVRLFRTPAAAVTLVDAERQWFKSIRGLEIRETPRNQSFCAHAMWGDEVMIVPDTTLDPRFRDNPLVTGKPGLRFYAGAPLRTPEGYPLGALCLFDYQPRISPWPSKNCWSSWRPWPKTNSFCAAWARNCVPSSNNARRRKLFRMQTEGWPRARLLCPARLSNRRLPAEFLRGRMATFASWSNRPVTRCSCTISTNASWM